MAISPINPVYTTRVKVSGGRNGQAVSEDGVLDLKLKSPGGAGAKEATNPEQLFAAGYAACYQSALIGASREAGVDASESVVESSVSLGREGAAGPFGLAVTLTVSIPGLEREKVKALADVAHQNCPYSRAIRGNVQVDIEAV